MEEEKKQRMIQEYVPGRQLTLAHIIANPQRDLSKKIELHENKVNAIGIEIGFVDRFTGSVVISGDVGSVDAAVNEVVSYFANILKFSITQITRS